MRRHTCGVEPHEEVERQGPNGSAATVRETPVQKCQRCARPAALRSTSPAQVLPLVLSWLTFAHGFASAGAICCIQCVSYSWFQIVSTITPGRATSVIFQTASVNPVAGAPTLRRILWQPQTVSMQNICMDDCKARRGIPVHGCNHLTPRKVRSSVQLCFVLHVT